MATTNTDGDGYEIEVLGTCKTNTRPDSQHIQQVDAKHLWSYAQEEALTALSEQGPDKCWRLITDPERRAKRIAARYADLYFASAEKSRGKVQLYWPALAAFVVKDIVEAYRYSRDNVLNGGWRNAARTSGASQLFAELATEGSPYEHSLRVYAALAKGNLWLFMDIYPWLWFVLEYGLNKDGSMNAERLTSHVSRRNAAEFQNQSEAAVRELPFGASWLGRLKGKLASDPVYAEGRSHFATPPTWAGLDGGYGQHVASALEAHRYVRQHAKDADAGNRTPPSKYWTKFDEAFYVMEEERREMGRIAADGAATARLQKVAQFTVTKEMTATYTTLIDEFGAGTAAARLGFQQDELNAIAKQEQLNILQPLIYDDSKLVKTMDINHWISRASSGGLSPTYTLYFSAAPKNDDRDLQITFDEPKSPWDRTKGALGGTLKSLPNKDDRMEYVSKIADKFNLLMSRKRAYMERELQIIRGWLDA